MKLVIIGAVAAGTSAAAKARRNDETAEIVIYEKDTDISYSACGMPYYLAGLIRNLEALSPRNPAYFRDKYDVNIRTGHEVLEIQPDRNTLLVRNLDTGEVFPDTYDTLILATGARAVLPPLPGLFLPHVFPLRTLNDMNRIDTFLKSASPKRAVILGTGFIGLECCEALAGLGLQVTLVEKLPQVTPGLDADMARLVEDHLREKGVSVHTGNGVAQVEPEQVALTDGTALPADLVIVATGVRPNRELAEAAGIRLGPTGAIAVDERMQTNLPHILACGDCIEQTHLVTGKPVYRPLGSTANKTGRIAGDVATGGSLAFRGILGTGIFRLFDRTVAQTGLSEREAVAAGYEVVVSHNIKPDRPEYMGGREMTIKSVADRATGRLLGVQIVGEAGVDKRIDVFATAISFGARAEDLFHLDLAYAPPFATTKDPVHYTGMILENALHRNRPLMTPDTLEELIGSGRPYTLIDARVEKQYDAGHIPTARSIPQDKLRQAAGTLDPDVPAITYCNKGVTGNAAQNILLGKGIRTVYNLSGGYRMYRGGKRPRPNA